MSQSKLIKHSEAIAATKETPPARKAAAKSLHGALKDWVRQHQKAKATNVRAAFQSLFIPSADKEKLAPR